MPTEAAIVTEGKVVSVLPGTMFRVELESIWRLHIYVGRCGSDSFVLPLVIA